MSMPKRSAGMLPEPAARIVLMVIESDYPSADGGGAEAQVQTLARNLPAPFLPTIVAPRVPYGPQAVHERVDGIQVERIVYPHVPLLGGLILLLRLAVHVIARRREVAAIHCHIAHNMAAVCCGVGWLLGLPVVVKLTGMQELEQGILSQHRTLAVRLRRWLIKRATAIQAISRDLERALLAFGFAPERVHLIPNAIDTERFAPARAERGAIRERLGIEAGFVACFIGRLVPEKALDTLLDAWSAAIPREASAAIVIVGIGPLEADLRQQATALGIEHQVRFAGFVSAKPLLADYWRSCDIGVLPSAFEGLSNALLEAMASAVPMIASEVSGNVDLVEPGVSGWLFPPRDVPALRRCLASAFQLSPAERDRLGDAARQRALATVGIDHVLGRLTALYDPAAERDARLCAG